MKRLLIGLAAIFALVGLYQVAAQQSPNTITDSVAIDEPTTKKPSFSKLDEYLSLLAQHDRAMLSVAIRSEGELIYEKAIGYSSFSDNKPATPRSLYRIGSISKMYLATVIMQLVEQNKLSLETKLADFYPEIQNADKITVKHLLSHRSGIYNFTNAPDYLLYMTQHKTKAELLNIIKKFDSNFEPGSDHEYSNSGYVLLGFIAEDVSNKSLSQLIQDNIVTTLEQSQTYLGGKFDAANGEVSSYRYVNGWQLAPVTDLSIPLGAGAIVSSASEVGEFHYQLFNGGLVTDASLAKMTTLADNYGLGITSFPFYEKRAFGHNGGIDGFISSSAYFVEDDMIVTVLSNGVNMNFNDIMIVVLSEVFNKPYELPNFTQSQLQLTEAQLPPFVGEYTSEVLQMDIRVFINDGALMAQATGQGPFPLQAYENNEFRFDAAGIVMKFANQNDGQFNQFELLQGGGRFMFKRK